MKAPDDIADWIASALGHVPRDVALFRRALTHGSLGAGNYERLEFLGDRVLGLVVAQWLFEHFPDEPEGRLSRRLNALVTGEVCAEVAREIGAPAMLRLGKQARDDGAVGSTNVLGDVMEALIGAVFVEAGLDAATALVRRLWRARVSVGDEAPRHPKSAIQEWAAATGKKPPTYALVSRAGPHHAPRFVVEATVPGAGAAQAEGATKQEAETAAAAKLLAALR